jgi:hypothetical protein
MIGRIAIIVLLLCSVASAETIEPEILTAPPKSTNTQWLIEMLFERPYIGTRGVDPDGRHIGISWTRNPVPEGAVLVLRRPVTDPDLKGKALRVVDRTGPVLIPLFLYPTDWKTTYHPAFDAHVQPIPPGTQVGEWTVVASSNGDPAEPIVDEVEPGSRYVYALVPAIRGQLPDTYDSFPGDAVTTWSVAPHASWFHPRRWMHLALILVIAVSLFVFTRLAKKRDLFLRRLPGVDAIEDAVGRSTEMGRPVLYVTGVEETQDIQTIASLLILGHVAKITAEYDTDLRVANAFPLTMVIAEEVVRQGYANAGRADAHRPENVMFITSEQFAFAAGVNGMILRERPATNIYFGRFYAESLMLAETGYLTGAVQIAGTAELTQLPFFISACDYTLMGEELFACSAYLTREPNQLALIKAGDTMKVVIALVVVGFTACATLAALGYYPFTRFSIEDVLP